MAREVLTVNVGQCGIQLGDTLWQQYCIEHSIDTNATNTIANTDKESAEFLNFFAETESGNYMPRNLMVDTESDSIERVKHSKYAKIFQPEFMLSGKEGACNNYARGYYTVGKQLFNEVTDKLRLLVENCDNLQGFVVNHSVGGGTGSGLGTLILEKLAADYSTKCTMSFDIYPNSNNDADGSVEHFNALLATNSLLETTQYSFVFDNRKLSQLCTQKLCIDTPSYVDLNNVIAKIASSITAPFRCSSQFVTYTPMPGNNTEHLLAIPFPKCHFITSSMAPLVNTQATMPSKQLLLDGYVRQNYCNVDTDTQKKEELHTDAPKTTALSSVQYEATLRDLIRSYTGPPPLYQDVMNALYTAYHIGYRTDFSTQEICEKACLSDSFCVEYTEFDAVQDKYMSLQLMYRGDVNEKQAHAANQWLRSEQKVCFPGWGRADIKVGINTRLQGALEDDVMAIGPRNVVMLGTNAGIHRFFGNRVRKPCKNMMERGALIDSFVREGMESGELKLAVEDLASLEQDYQDSMAEAATDDEDSD